MTLLPGIIHFFTIAASTVCAALGVSIGQGFTSQAAFNAINRQPAAQPDITRTTLLALALIETSAILRTAYFISLFFKIPNNQWAVIAEIGMGVAISFPGLVIGLASSMPAYEALGAIARQPFLASKLSNFMLLTQSLIQTPLIFGFIVALIIRTKIPHVTNASAGARAHWKRSCDWYWLRGTGFRRWLFYQKSLSKCRNESTCLSKAVYFYLYQSGNYRNTGYFCLDYFFFSHH